MVPGTYSARLIAVGGLALAAACASRGLPSTAADQAAFGPRERGLTVEVWNQNFYEVTIYAYREGNRTRLGTVNSNGTEFFTFDWLLTEVRFLVNFLSVGCLLTESLTVSEDDDLLLILQAADHQRASRTVCGR